jgi:hypothetical protein
MTRDTIIYRCKGCGASIHVNFTTRKVTFLGKDDAKARDLDELVADQAQDAQRRQDQFEAAVEKNATEKERLEALFDDARKNVEEEEEEPGRPPNPFDLE